jgi:hypothetical protein
VSAVEGERREQHDERAEDEKPEEASPVQSEMPSAVDDAAGAAILKGIDVGLCQYTAKLFDVFMKAAPDDKEAKTRFMKGLGKAVRAYEAIRAEMDL